MRTGPRSLEITSQDGSGMEGTSSWSRAAVGCLSPFGFSSIHSIDATGRDRSDFDSSQTEDDSKSRRSYVPIKRSRMLSAEDKTIKQSIGTGHRMLRVVEIRYETPMMIWAKNYV